MSSPAQSEIPQPVRKRRRKAFSCVDCKRRKVKCDRAWPACGRCVKGGHQDTCQYISHDGALVPDNDNVEEVDESVGGDERARNRNGSVILQDFPGHQPDQGDLLTNSYFLSTMRQQEEKIGQLESRIVGLEKLMNWNDRKRTFSQMTQGQIPVTLTTALQDETHKTIVFKGKGFKTSFHGSTSSYGLARQVSHPHSFTEIPKAGV